MVRLKRLFIVSVVVLLFANLFACDDFVERGIEGQWQLKTIVQPDGSEQQVDTVFYLFKKKVFKSILLVNELEVEACFGTYQEGDGKLAIAIDTTINEYVCPECLGWNSFEQTFNVEKQTSSDLRLKTNENQILIFRKY